jgi:hypothetical protein
VKGKDLFIVGKDKDKADELLRGLDWELLNRWIQEIKKESKKLCDDPDCERIKIELNAIGQFEFKIKDKKALECIKSSLENIKKSMPVNTYLAFANLIVSHERNFKSGSMSTIFN